jgi:hypothetical protein
MFSVPKYNFSDKNGNRLKVIIFYILTLYITSSDRFLPQKSSFEGFFKVKINFSEEMEEKSSVFPQVVAAIGGKYCKENLLHIFKL